MKRITALISLILILTVFSSTVVFASGLTVTDITPKDGETGKQPQNMAVKVTFSQDMMDETAIAANKAFFRIKNAQGVDQAFEIMYSAEKYPDQLWLVLEQTLESDSEYSVEILPGVISAKGDTLNEGMTTTFKIRNTATDAKVSMGLMAVMMIFMFSATSKAAKKTAEKESFETSGKIKEENLNPYKISKIKGISLEEATAYVEKEKAKIAKREQKLEEERRRIEAEKAAEMEAIEAELQAAEHSEGKFRVAGPHSVKDAGGRVPRAIVKKNKARREAEKAAEKVRNSNKNKKKK